MVWYFGLVSHQFGLVSRETVKVPKLRNVAGLSETDGKLMISFPLVSHQFVKKVKILATTTEYCDGWMHTKECFLEQWCIMQITKHASLQKQ